MVVGGNILSSFFYWNGMIILQLYEAHSLKFQDNPMALSSLLFNKRFSRSLDVENTIILLIFICSYSNVLT